MNLSPTWPEENRLAGDPYPAVPGTLPHAPDQRLVQTTPAPWSTLAQFLGFVYDHHLALDEGGLAMFEPRRTRTPDGYCSTKCVAAGLYALLTQAKLAADDGELLPTEITGSTICYRVLECGVPVYFVSDDFARAVAATRLPDDFTFGDLNWPHDGMVVGWPQKFIREYTGRELGYVFAANCPAGSYHPPGLPQMPVIEVPEGRSKIGWFYHAWANGRPECFVSAYLTRDKLAESVAGYVYTDYMSEGPAKVEADKALTERVSALMLKLLVIVNLEGSFITVGGQERPGRVRRGKVARSELWEANFIGRGYRLTQESSGTHASPRMHIRRGHVTWQATGPHSAPGFVSTRLLPRTDQGGIDWVQVGPDVREKFMHCHRRLWLQPVLVGAGEAPGANASAYSRVGGTASSVPD
jgi:hypothetical protein